MKITRDKLMELIRDATIGKELQSSVVYVASSIKAGEEWVINRTKTKLTERSTMVFIDLEPQANWSHRCRYVFIGDDNKVLLKKDGEFPPDADRLKLFLKPDDVQDWMLLTNRLFDENAEL